MQPSLPNSDSPSASDHSQIEKLIDDASEGIEQAVATESRRSESFQPFRLDRLSESPVSGSTTSIDTLSEVELDLRIELGRTQMSLQDVLQLRDGSVIALDSFAGDAVNIFVNDRIVARGEILVMNDHFCVRVTELVGA
ncbi:flagellar motor switch protein FliN [Stieleria marina]